MRLIPAQFVKPYRKSNKNDFIDAEAIAEAVTKQVSNPSSNFSIARLVHITSALRDSHGLRTGEAPTHAIISQCVDDYRLSRSEQ